MRYYFHLREGQDRILDEDGLELAGFEAAREAALQGARSIIAAEAMAGRLPLRSVIEVEDGDGRRVMEMPFTDAVALDG